ncbi:MAG: TonB-dependent receptor [Pseudomonadota bacterium]|nr:TonB-dependent receptor [Pseudomonadota bacterium]
MRDPKANSRNLKLLRRCLVGAGSVFAFAATAAQAQPADAPVDEIVVIGTPGGAGASRQAASFAITTINPDEITKFSPQSTADLFKSIPGVWVESSGGVAGANIDVRGLPGGGDAPFVLLAINGSPIYGTEMLSFFEQSSIFRIDETIAGVEGLRGGPNSVFGKGEPGLTVNFNLKEGGEETEGRIKYSTSDYGLQRVDAVLSGKLDDDLYYMIGGYFRSSDGVRDTQFKSEEGYQFTANLTKVFDNGKINLFARATDDHGQWVLPMALNTGNDLGTFAQLGNDTRFRELQVNAAGDTEIFDFADGRGWKGVVTGGSAEFDLGSGFTIRDQFTFMTGDADTYGFVPSGSPVTAGDVSAVIGGGPVMTQSGATLADSEYVQTYGHWVVQKDLQAAINDLSINKVISTHDITVGYYQSTWSSDDWWNIGNPIPVHNVANGEALDPSITPADIAAAGGDAGFNFRINSAGDAHARAVYIADSWQVFDRFRLDVGARREWLEIDYVLDTDGPDGMGGTTGFPDGTPELTTELNGSEWAYTAAGNYDVTDDLGVFVRYTKGFLFPHFDEIREGRNQVDSVKQIEAGVKYGGEWFNLYATAFRNTNDAFSSTVGGVVPASQFRTRAYGVEVDGEVFFGPFSTNVTATIQDAEITDSTTPSDIGNQVLRQPKWQARISPAYTLDVNGFEATLYGAVSLVGERFGDNGNTVVLPSYEKVDLGLLVNAPSGLFFQVHADNLNDSHGITEGDPRNPAAPNGRPIFGRSVMFSVGYDF